jgi:pyroglutamyl-peptidase
VKIMATASTAAAMEDKEERHGRSTCHFVITGFGPFNGVSNNPTISLTNKLANAMRENSSSSSNGNIKNNIVDSPVVHVFETSAGYVQYKMGDIFAQLRRNAIAAQYKEEGGEQDDKEDEDSGGKNNDDIEVSSTSTKTTILLHLGVDSEAKQFKLEQCAYNDATFRVKDERGYQPTNECIPLPPPAASTHGEWGECIKTTLNLVDLLAELEKHHENDIVEKNEEENDNCSVIISTDPGRFVCNYTYYLSLNRCRFINDEFGRNNNNNASNRGTNDGDAKMKKQVSVSQHHALFVHVPPFDVIPEIKQLDFICRLMMAIGRQINTVK